MSQDTLSPRKVDHTGLKVGQAITILLLIIAFILSSWVLVALVAISQFLGALNVPFAPYRLIYQRILLPTKRVTPNIITDNPEPHRFALLVGALFNTAGTLSLLSGASLIGWTLVWIVICAGKPELLAELLRGMLDVLPAQPRQSAGFHRFAHRKRIVAASD
ncbi:MAG: DUF4395 family protein [Anaerolineae bacterium]